MTTVLALIATLILFGAVYLYAAGDRFASAPKHRGPVPSRGPGLGAVRSL